MAIDPKQAYVRLEALKADRHTYDQHCQELADYCLPAKNVITREPVPGEKRLLHIYDSIGIHSVKLLSGALHGMLTNPSAYWFQYTTGIPELDRNDNVRRYLQKITHITHEVMNNSNFQTEIHELYMDELTFGTGIMSVEEDEESVVRFSARHIKDCWLDENSKGKVDTVFREYRWKPRQIMEEFGDKVPKFVLDKAKTAPEEKMCLMELTCPNMEYDKGKKLSVKGKKFITCTYIKNGSSEHTLLEEKGFNTFPFVTPRWTKGTGEVNGRSPAMEALADIKMVNEMMKETIRAQQKATNPPLLVPDDGIVGSLRQTPGGISYYRAGNGDFIKPLLSGVDLLLSEQMIEGVRNRIRSCFYVDQLKLQEGPQMTATEVMQRTEENNRLMGPVLGRQHSELLRPLIDRVFEIGERRGIYPPAPIELKNHAKIDVKYRSMLAKAQLATEANNMSRAFQAAAPFIGLDQAASDVINADEGVRYIANLYDIPQDLIRDEEEIEALREARDEANRAALEAKQQDAAAEQIGKMTPAVKAVAESA